MDAVVHCDTLSVSATRGKLGVARCVPSMEKSAVGDSGDGDVVTDVDGQTLTVAEKRSEENLDCVPDRDTETVGDTLMAAEIDIVLETPATATDTVALGQCDAEPKSELDGEMLPRLTVGATVAVIVPLQLSVAVAACDGGSDWLDDGQAKLKLARCVPSIEFSGESVPRIVYVRVPVARADAHYDTHTVFVPAARTDSVVVVVTDSVPDARGV